MNLHFTFNEKEYELRLFHITVKSLVNHLRDMERVLQNSQSTLDNLLQHHNHSEIYFEEQWKRQREMQLNIIESGNSKALYKKLEALIELEEMLRDSEYTKNQFFFKSVPISLSV